MLRTIAKISVLSLAFVIVSCGSQKEVSRMDPDSRTDLSGRWNDTDSKLVAEEMVEDALSRAWLENHKSNNDGEQPTIIVGVIKNKTHEHINPQTFIKDIEKEFINRNKVRVVQSGEFRDQLREERADQQKYASVETQKDWGKELGADYMMTGIMSSTVDQNQDEKVVFYKTNLELTDLETNEKVWIGDKEIKKYIEE